MTPYLLSYAMCGLVLYVIVLAGYVEQRWVTNRIRQRRELPKLPVLRLLDAVGLFLVSVAFLVCWPIFIVIAMWGTGAVMARRQLGAEE